MLTRSLRRPGLIGGSLMASITTDKNDTLCFEIDGLQEILHWLLSWAGRVRVKEPEELRELFLNALKAAVEMNYSPR
jgi:predicted DNA-binding transcriptional regulator YafY